MDETPSNRMPRSPGATESAPRFAVFNAWVATQRARAATSTKKREQFSEKTGAIYASLWRGWVEWLAAQHGLEWPQATASHVHSFLDGPAPAPSNKRRTRTPIDASKMQSYTQQRYWRVLQAVYSHAVVTGLIDHSPCVGDGKRRAVEPSALKRRILPQGTLGQLRNPRTLAELIPLESAQQWWVLRDRAAVALVAHCGLTVAQLRALRGQDLRAGAQVLTAPSGQDVLPQVEVRPAVATVDLPAAGGHPPRHLELPPAALAAVMPWLAQRAQMLADQAAAFRRAGVAIEPAHKQPLLLSREAPDGGPRPAIEAATIYLVFKRCLQAALGLTGSREPGNYTPQGPSSVRNSLIAEWAAKMPVEQAALLAGVQPRALRATNLAPQITGDADIPERGRERE